MSTRTEKWLHCTLVADGLSTVSLNHLHLVKLDTWIRYSDTWIYDRIAMKPLAYFCYSSSSLDPSLMATGSLFAGLTTNTTILLFTTATPAPTIVTTCTSFLTQSQLHALPLPSSSP